MTVYSRIDSDSDIVSVTFISGDISTTTEMTKEEYTKYVSGS